MQPKLSLHEHAVMHMCMWIHVNVQDTLLYPQDYRKNMHHSQSQERQLRWKVWVYTLFKRTFPHGEDRGSSWSTWETYFHPYPWERKVTKLHCCQLCQSFIYFLQNKIEIVCAFIKTVRSRGYTCLMYLLFQFLASFYLVCLFALGSTHLWFFTLIVC